MFLAEVNDHLLHSDGDMSRYFIDKEHKSCLDTDEDKVSNLETIQDQRSMSDGPVIKPTKRYVSNDLFTREQLINAQKE
jgi:lipopolysaccharide biosynthesis protein